MDAGIGSREYPGAQDFYLLDPLQLDAVREAANIGAAHAAGALAQVTGLRVRMEPPRVAVKSLFELSRELVDEDGQAAVVVDTIVGDITGRVVFIAPWDGSALPPATSDIEQGLEVFRRAADSIIASYVDHIARVLGLVLAVEPGPPGRHSRRELMTGLWHVLQEGKRFAFCIDSRYLLDNGRQCLRGHFLFLPEVESLPVILRALFGGRTTSVSSP